MTGVMKGLSLAQPMLFLEPIAGVYPIGLAEANRLIVRWEDDLGYRADGWELVKEDAGASSGTNHGRPVANMASAGKKRLRRWVY